MLDSDLVTDPRRNLLFLIFRVHCPLASSPLQPALLFTTQKAKEGQQAPQAVPQLLKRDGQVYVREVDGEEHAAKLIKTEDGRIFAEYM